MLHKFRELPDFYSIFSAGKKQYLPKNNLCFAPGV
jgi:hypothetical protein